MAVGARFTRLLQCNMSIQSHFIDTLKQQVDGSTYSPNCLHNRRMPIPISRAEVVLVCWTV